MLLLRTFGGLSVENAAFIGGAAARRRPLAVLAILAVGGRRGLSRDKLTALLWPESEQERARNSLSQSITVLRRELAVDDLVLGSVELRLNPDAISSDVAEFEAALELKDYRRAVDLYTGPFLDGVFLKNAPEFERWVDAERARLEHCQSDALERLARAAADRGDGHEAVTWWRRRAAVDATNSAATMGLIRALVDAGDRDGAIRQAKIYAALVRSELGDEPDAGVMRLVEQLRVAPVLSLGTSAAVNASPVTQQREGVQEFETAVVIAPKMGIHSSLPGSTEVGGLDAGLRRNDGERNARKRGNDGEGNARKRGNDGGYFTRHRRLAWGTALALSAFVVLGIAYAYVSHPRAESRLVIVPPFENQTGDTAITATGSMAADWVRQGLAQTGLVEVADTRAILADEKGNAGSPIDAKKWLTIARQAGAGMLVRGSIYQQHDSLIVRVQVVRPRDGKVLYEGGPTTGPATEPRAIIEVTRQRVMGAFAAFEDAHFARWQQALLEPPRYDAYQEFIAGIETMNRSGNGAFEHFLTAARLDTTFVQAKLWAYETGEGAVTDSLVAAARAQRERLSPFDRAALDFTLAERASDRDGALLAARHMTEIAPSDDYALLRHATAALFTNRFDEALREVRRADIHRDWVRQNRSFWNWDFLVHHYAGDYAGEFREAMRCAETDGTPKQRCRQGALLVLAALGREASVDSLFGVAQSSPDRAVEGAFFLTVAAEYRAHGHRAEERRALERARQWYAAQHGEFKEGLFKIDWQLGNWVAVRDFLVRQAASGNSGKATQGPVECGQLGVAAAHLGDTTTALAMIQRIAVVAPAESFQKPLWQAIVTAAIGDRVRAMNLLEDAVARGYSVVVHGHQNVGLDPLRGYGPFEALGSPRR